MTNEEIVKNFKLVQEQMNDLTARLNDFIEMKYKTNSDAIDQLVIASLEEAPITEEEVK